MCVQVIGAGALNQAIKAIAIARSFVSDDGIDPVCIPMFHDVDIGGESRTAIRLHVEHRTSDAAGALDATDEPPQISASAP